MARQFVVTETENRIRAVAMYRAGVHIKWIISAHRMSLETLYLLLKQHGVPLRGRNGPREEVPESFVWAGDDILMRPSSNRASTCGVDAALRMSEIRTRHIEQEIRTGKPNPVNGAAPHGGMR